MGLVAKKEKENNKKKSHAHCLEEKIGNQMLRKATSTSKKKNENDSEEI